MKYRYRIRYFSSGEKWLGPCLYENEVDAMIVIAQLSEAFGNTYSFEIERVPMLELIKGGKSL